jgi:anti-sigma B factor antagonist
MPTLHFPPKVEHKGHVTVITFTGRRNCGVESAVASELEGRTESVGESHFLLDFINMEVISGVDLGALVTFQNKTRASGKQLTLFNLDANVYEVFSITKLDTVFDILRKEAHQLMPTHA